MFSIFIYNIDKKLMLQVFGLLYKKTHITHCKHTSFTKKHCKKTTNMESFPKLCLYATISTFARALDGTPWAFIVGQNDKVQFLSNGRIAKNKTELKPGQSNPDAKWYRESVCKFDMEKRTSLVTGAISICVKLLMFAKTREEFQQKSQTLGDDNFEVEMLRNGCRNFWFSHYKYKHFCKLMNIISSSFSEMAHCLYTVDLEQQTNMSSPRMFMYFVVATFRAYVDTIDVYARKPQDMSKVNNHFLQKSKHFYAGYVLASPHEKQSHKQMVNIVVECIKESFAERRTPVRYHDYDNYADYDNNDFIDCYFPSGSFFDDNASFEGSYLPDSHMTFDEAKYRRQMMGRKHSKKVVAHDKTKTKKSQKKHDNRIF